MDNKPESNAITDRHIDKPIATNVEVKKHNFLQSMAKAFIKSDAETVKNAVINGVVIPTISNLIIEAITSAVETTFGGTSRTTKIFSNKGGVTQYSSIFGSKKTKTGGAATVAPSASHRFRSENYIIRDQDDIPGSGRAVALEIRDELLDILRDYPAVSVGDFISACGITPTSTDYNYGWYSLEGVSIKRVADGYILMLPDPVPLKK